MLSLLFLFSCSRDEELKIEAKDLAKKQKFASVGANEKSKGCYFSLDINSRFYDYIDFRNQSIHLAGHDGCQMYSNLRSDFFPGYKFYFVEDEQKIYAFTREGNDCATDWLMFRIEENKLMDKFSGRVSPPEGGPCGQFIMEYAERRKDIEEFEDLLRVEEEEKWIDEVDVNVCGWSYSYHFHELFVRGNYLDIQFHEREEFKQQVFQRIQTDFEMGTLVNFSNEYLIAKYNNQNCDSWKNSIEYRIKSIMGEVYREWGSKEEENIGCSLEATNLKSQLSRYGSLTSAQENWICNTANERMMLKFQDFINSTKIEKSEASSIILFSIDHFYEGFITEDIFDNWFMSPMDEFDDGEVFNMANYQNAQITTYRLPSLAQFVSQYPMGGIESVYDLIGGSLKDNHKNYPIQYKFSCSLRLSRALNYSGISIPIWPLPPAKQKTEKGDDGKNYILNASSALGYMLKAFPQDKPIEIEGSNAFRVYEYFYAAVIRQRKKGIYIMVPRKGSGFGATGHCDYFDGQRFHTGGYLNSVDSLYFWELK
nr:type VI secretion system amidase effector protein Tae4 [Sphingobacterium bovistauri]